MTRLNPGDPAPTFQLSDQHGRTVALEEFSGGKVILFVYPAAMTPGCTREACDFRDAALVLKAAGYSLLGLSPDPVGTQELFARTHDLPFPLLSDPGRDTLKAYGAYGVKKLYGKEVTGVIRSTFVIDAEGRIELARYNVRATGHVASLAKTLQIALPA